MSNLKKQISLAESEINYTYKKKNNMKDTAIGYWKSDKKVNLKKIPLGLF